MSNSSTRRSTFWSSVKEIAILLLIVFIIRTVGFGLYQVPTCSMETTMLTGERFFADKFTVLFRNINRGEIISMNAPTYKFSPNPLVYLFQKYVWGPDNWTKRVIGIPGDTVRGVVENGKPEVYLNDKKLNDPYLNKYPIIQVWKKDPAELQAMVQKNPRLDLGQFLSPRSFNPKIPFGKQQPFYNFKKEQIFINPTTGTPVILEPGTPLPEKGTKITKGKNYWNNGDEFYVELGKNQYWLMGDNRLGSHDSRAFGPVDGSRIHGKILFRISSVDTDEGWPIWDFIKGPIDFIKRVRWNRFFQKVK